MIECNLPTKSKLKGLEADLYNLEIRLEIQKKWVANTESFEERKAYNRLLDFVQLNSIYHGIPVEDGCDNEKNEDID